MRLEGGDVGAEGVVDVIVVGKAVEGGGDDDDDGFGG